MVTEIYKVAYHIIWSWNQIKSFSKEKSTHCHRVTYSQRLFPKKFLKFPPFQGMPFQERWWRRVTGNNDDPSPGDMLQFPRAVIAEWFRDTNGIYQYLLRVFSAHGITTGRWLRSYRRHYINLVDYSWALPRGKLSLRYREFNSTRRKLFVFIPFFDGSSWKFILFRLSGGCRRL